MVETIAQAAIGSPTSEQVSPQRRLSAFLRPLYFHNLISLTARLIVVLQEMQAAYAECAEEELGLLLAERLSRLGLRPFDRTSVLRASRQIDVVAHHQQLMMNALAAPLRPLPRGTRVLVAMCSISERENFFPGLFRCTLEEADPQRVRDFYRSNLADELCCDGSHLEVCARCATNRDSEFTVRLASFLRAIEAAAASGSSRELQCDGIATRLHEVEEEPVAESLVAAIRAYLRRCGGGGRRGKRRAAQEAQEMAQA